MIFRVVSICMSSSQPRAMPPEVPYGTHACLTNLTIRALNGAYKAAHKIDAEIVLLIWRWLSVMMNKKDIGS